MKIVCVANAIKETLSVRDAQRALIAGARESGVGTVESVLMSDGGDGFADVYLQRAMSEVEFVDCVDPLGREQTASLSWVKGDNLAVIESADAIGLKLVDTGSRDIMQSSSAGLADVVYAAIAVGAKRIVVGLGGSATCDGGAGFLSRLAILTKVKSSLKVDELVNPRNMNQINIGFISELREKLAGLQLIALADVKNPLLGSDGTAAQFARQKGASATQIIELENLITGFSEDVTRDIKFDYRNVGGAGAAGGLGFAFMVCGGQVLPGTETICELLNIKQMLSSGCHVLTCEGKFDMTSLNGKAPGTIADMALKSNAKVTIFCAIADGNAVETATGKGIRVVEFGRDISERERCTLTSSALTRQVFESLRFY